MGFLDALLGRTKPIAANLDALFGLPGARITLEAAEGLQPSGEAGVCYKPSAGQDFAAAEKELEQLLQLKDGDDAGSDTMAVQADEYGYRWTVLRSKDFDELVTRVHVVNSTLREHGFDQQLLCSVFGFTPSSPEAEKAYVVYLYKRGTFYPFVPLGNERRDNEAELRLKNELSEDLKIEAELDRWFPIWSLPIS